MVYQLNPASVVHGQRYSCGSLWRHRSLIRPSPRPSRHIANSVAPQAALPLVRSLPLVIGWTHTVATGSYHGAGLWFTTLCALSVALGALSYNLMAVLEEYFDRFDRRKTQAVQPRTYLHGVDVTGSRFLRLPRVVAAVEFAAAAHASQRRKTGEPYVRHCIETALIVEACLPQHHSEEEQERHVTCIMAAVLHDVLDDTPTDPASLHASFGPRVAALVGRVSQLSQMNQLLRRGKRQGWSQTSPDHQRRLRRLIVDLAFEEPLVVLVKLADRLHNMRTVWVLPRDKQRAVAEESAEVWCSLAESLGWDGIKSEMEDLCFAVLQPATYCTLRAELDRLWCLPTLAVVEEAEGQQGQGQGGGAAAGGAGEGTGAAAAAGDGLGLRIVQLPPGSAAAAAAAGGGASRLHYTRAAGVRAASRRAAAERQEQLQLLELQVEEEGQQQLLLVRQPGACASGEVGGGGSSGQSAAEVEAAIAAVAVPLPPSGSGSRAHMTPAVPLASADRDIASAVGLGCGGGAHHEGGTGSSPSSCSSSSGSSNSSGSARSSTCVAEAGRGNISSVSSSSSSSSSSNSIGGVNCKSSSSGKSSCGVFSLNSIGTVSSDNSSDGSSYHACISSLAVESSPTCTTMESIDGPVVLLDDQVLPYNATQFATSSSSRSDMNSYGSNSSSDCISSDGASSSSGGSGSSSSLQLPLPPTPSHAPDPTSSFSPPSSPSPSSPAPCLSPDPPPASAPLLPLDAQQQRLRSVLSSVVPFESVGFKSVWGVASSTRRGLEVLDECAALLYDEIQIRSQAGGLAINIQGRLKSLQSVYRKMVRKGCAVAQVYDSRALRVIVDDADGSQLREAVEACYRLVGAVHSLWKPIRGEFDDYIANPKQSGYQALHTAVRGPGGIPMEVQIKTSSMHHLAEYGAAAHWVYKEEAFTQLLGGAAGGGGGVGRGGGGGKPSTQPASVPPSSSVALAPAGAALGAGNGASGGSGGSCGKGVGAPAAVQLPPLPPPPPQQQQQPSSSSSSSSASKPGQRVQPDSRGAGVAAPPPPPPPAAALPPAPPPPPPPPPPPAPAPGERVLGAGYVGQPLLKVAKDKLRYGVVVSRECEGQRLVAAVKLGPTFRAFPTRVPDYGFYGGLLAYTRDKGWQIPGHGDLVLRLEEFVKCADGRYHRRDHMGYLLPAETATLLEGFEEEVLAAAAEEEEAERQEAEREREEEAAAVALAAELLAGSCNSGNGSGNFTDTESESDSEVGTVATAAGAAATATAHSRKGSSSSSSSISSRTRKRRSGSSGGSSSSKRGSGGGVAELLGSVDEDMLAAAGGGGSSGSSGGSGSSSVAEAEAAQRRFRDQMRVTFAKTQQLRSMIEWGQGAIGKSSSSSTSSDSSSTSSDEVCVLIWPGGHIEHFARGTTAGAIVAARGVVGGGGGLAGGGLISGGEGGDGSRGAQLLINVNNRLVPEDTVLNDGDLVILAREKVRI